MKKFALAIALMFSVLASQAQTKSAPGTEDKTEDDRKV
jgi:lipoprotein Spr